MGSSVVLAHSDIFQRPDGLIKLLTIIRNPSSHSRSS